MFSWAYGSGELIKGIENDEIWISSTTFFIIDYQNKKEKPDMDGTGKIFTIIFWNWKLLNLPYLSFNNTVLEVIWKKKKLKSLTRRKPTCFKPYWETHLGNYIQREYTSLVDYYR